MSVYYNEIEPFAAAWLRNLMWDGIIPFGEVDERSIKQVSGSDVKGFTQCHFFAGIGGWPYALQLAGVGKDTPIWTGSCPCQPFSAAGKRKGVNDERHLWPEFCRLIAECRPPTVFGEQVASKDGREWLAGVRADLEALGYAVGGADLCAAGVGAPHIRQRLFWVADAQCGTAERYGHQMAGAPEDLQRKARQQRVRSDAGDGSAVKRVADADGRIARDRDVQRSGQHGQQPQDGCAGERVADANQGQRRWFANSEGRERDWKAGGRIEGDGEPQPSGATFWSGAEYLQCLDGKSRRVEPSIFPLAHGVPGRVGRLRAYGNAIIPQVAAEFIQSVMECCP